MEADWAAVSLDYVLDLAIKRSLLNLSYQNTEGFQRKHDFSPLLPT